MTKVQEVKQPVGMKVKVDPKREELVITIPLSEYRKSKMVQADLSSYPLVGDGKKQAIIDGKKVMVDNPDANYRVASTFNFASVNMDDFDHISFSLNAIAKRKPIQEEKVRLFEMEQQRKLANEIQSERAAVTPQPSAPTMDMQEYQEFLEFKKWKQMMASAK